MKLKTIDSFYKICYSRKPTTSTKINILIEVVGGHTKYLKKELKINFKNP